MYEEQGNSKNNNDKFLVDQLLISHPHQDHISGIKEFRDSFYADLITCPNDNEGMEETHKIDWDLLEENPNVDILREMVVGRQPPLRATHEQNEFIFYLPPVDVEYSDELSNESYCNNISLVVFLIIKQHRIFIPGDIQKLGMIELMNRNHRLKNKLRGGVDVLITPHHGLRSSFCTDLFGEMKNNKTKCLNVVSEKPNSGDNREVDTRYSSSDYCEGQNNLGEIDDPSYQVKTSRGHILIDYSGNNLPYFEIIIDNEQLIKRFLEI